jgi:hypothetical protein
MNAREEANGRPNRRGRSGRKPRVHKKGGGKKAGNSKLSYTDYRRVVAPVEHDSAQPKNNSAKRNNRTRRKPRPKKDNNKNPQSKRTGKGLSKTPTKAITLQPIKCPSSSIMRSWKQELGSLIRYYVHERCKLAEVSQKEAEEEIDKIYYSVGCGKEETKLEILRRLGMKDTDKDLVDVTMIIEKDEQMMDVPTSKERTIDNSVMDGSEIVSYTETRDGKGLKLHQIVRSGEGPAHSHERWTNVVIPDWAIGKSFFFECKNNAPIPLSCELFLDGKKVAFNAPLPSNSDRSIKPDNPRYSHRHQWILAPAKRVKLSGIENAINTTSHPIPTPRYNGIRPDYGSQRISAQLYPDATNFGWKFTGSQQSSRVEFFEKTLNMGLVKLDFYYTTGTVKTTLFHAVTGKNQLFRGDLTPEKYVEVLNNPRAHTNQGYRRRIDRPVVQGVSNVMDMNEDESEDEFDRPPPREAEVADDYFMDEGRDTAVDATYYARNDCYNFNLQGHQNRRSEMDKLQRCNEFSQWKEANMAEYSCIHALFYVSIPRRQHGGQVKVQQQRRKKHKELLPIPNQSSIVDIKAAEKATLGTKFEPTGPPQRIVKSYVRMERINGLRDEKDWKGEPVFEKKLYYRAEHILKGLKVDGDSDEDDMSEDDDTAIVPSDNTSLDKYKSLMIEKIQQHNPEMNNLFPPDDAEMKICYCVSKILQAASEQDVDDQVRMFLDEFVPRQFTQVWEV